MLGFRHHTIYAVVGEGCRCAEACTNHSPEQENDFNYDDHGGDYEEEEDDYDNDD